MNIKQLLTNLIATLKPEWSSEQAMACAAGVMARAEQPYTKASIDTASTEQLQHDDCCELMADIFRAADELYAAAPKGSPMHAFANNALNGYTQPLWDIVAEYEGRCLDARAELAERGEQ